MPKGKRPRAEAIHQSPHVLYEIQMLGALREHFRRGDHDAAVKGLPLEGLASRNALVESFQIHARQLIDFLTDQPDDKEATAHDYAKGDWRIPTEDAAELKRLSGEFSQRVAHLSWRRSGAKQVRALVWTEGIYAAIRKHLLDFLSQVDPERVEADFVAKAHKALPATPEPLTGIDLIKAVVPSAAGVVTAATTSLSPPPTGGTATHMLAPDSYIDPAQDLDPSSTEPPNS